jgi:hypothetical protein
MPKRKHRFVRHETAEGWVPNLNAEGANVIFRKFEAQRKASHGRLGTPEGCAFLTNRCRPLKRSCGTNSLL